jgi:hypothetical protein
VYLAIIALWVMFLIPWLGRHREEQNGRKSADRYHRAMDTLARARDTIRHPGVQELGEDLDEEPDDGYGDDSDALGPGRPALDFAGAADAWSTVVGVLRPSAAARRSPAARRRRLVMLILGTGFAATLAGAALGYLPAFAPVALGGLLIGYLTLLLRQARTTAGPSARGASAEADRYRQATRRAQEQARGLYAPPASAERSTTGWDAVPTTLPTYVSKPKAAKVPRVVDLASGSPAWTGEEMVQRAMQERQRAQQEAARQQFEREMAAVEPDRTDEVAALANPTQPLPHQRQTYRRAANG